jgi:hypothetical protein
VSEYPLKPSAWARPEYPHTTRKSSQLGVLRFGLLEDGDIGVGAFPEAEEILVGSSALVLIPGQIGGEVPRPRIQSRCGNEFPDEAPALAKHEPSFEGPDGGKKDGFEAETGRSLSGQVGQHQDPHDDVEPDADLEE